MCLSLIMKIVKSAVLGYVIRRSLKDTDNFICTKEAKEKQDFLCEDCCNLVPVKLFRVTVYDPFCPFCGSEVDYQVFEDLYPVEDTQEDNKNKSNSNVNEFDGLDYLLHNGS